MSLLAGQESGSVFPLGDTVVTYRATDAAGLSAECSFTVRVAEVRFCSKPTVTPALT